MHRNNKLIFLVFVLIVAAFSYSYFNNSTGAATRYDYDCVDMDGTDPDVARNREWDDSYYTASYVATKGQKYYDECSTSRLKERYCDKSGAERLADPIACPTGYECRDGACRTELN